MDDQCSVCLTEEINDRCQTNCGHGYCKECLDSWFDRGNKSCPLCRQDIQYITHGDETYRVVLPQPQAQPQPQLGPLGPLGEPQLAQLADLAEPGPTVSQIINGRRYMYIHANLFRILVGSIITMGLLVSYELIKIYELHVANQDANQLYNSCDHELQTQNHVIEGLNNDQEFTLILRGDILHRCMIPVHYIRTCLSG